MAEEYRNGAPGNISASDLDDDESVASRSFADDFSCNIFDPDVRIKLRKSLLGVLLGGHLTIENPRQHGLQKVYPALTLRPCTRRDDFKGKLLNKVSIDGKKGEAVWSLGKMQFLDILKVKLEIGYNVFTKTPLWQYRVTTKWNQDSQHAVHKTPIELVEGRLKMVPNFHLEYSLPAMGGGSAGHENEAESGSCHLKMPRLDFVVGLDRCRPAQKSEVVLKLQKPGKGNQDSIEEIPVITLLSEDTSPKESCKSVERKQSSQEKSPVEFLTQESRDRRQLPAPWGNRNPFKLPWISADQWYTEDPADKIQISLPPKSRLKISAWGLDATHDRL